MDSLALIGSLVGGNVLLVGAIVFLIRNQFKNGKSNGKYATPTEVDEVHERLNDHIGKTNEHCRIQVAECNKVHSQLLAQDAKHDARYESIIASLARIENNGKH